VWVGGWGVGHILHSISPEKGVRRSGRHKWIIPTKSERKQLRWMEKLIRPYRRSGCARPAADEAGSPRGSGGGRRVRQAPLAAAAVGRVRARSEGKEEAEGFCTEASGILSLKWPYKIFLSENKCPAKCAWCQSHATAAPLGSFWRQRQCDCRAAGRREK
jgi:hypothetical protein